MKINRSKKHNKPREISPRQARKAAWAAERAEAGLANTPPATKVADSFPTLTQAKICRLCDNQADCDLLDPAITECSDFIRRVATKSVELLPTEPKPSYNHLNRKAYALAGYRNQLLAQWEFHRAEQKRLEAEISAIEKDIHKAVIAKTLCPAYQPPSKLFRAAEAAKADPATKANKATWADLELD